MSDVFELPMFARQHTGHQLLDGKSDQFAIAEFEDHDDLEAVTLAINSYDDNQAEIADQQRKLDNKVKLIKFTDKANSEMSQEIADLKEQLTNLTLAKSSADVDAFKMSKLRNDVNDENAGLKCQVNEFKVLIKFDMDSAIERLIYLAEQTPQQCLASVKADAVKGCYKYCVSQPCGTSILNDIKVYENKLREQANETQTSD